MLFNCESHRDKKSEEVRVGDILKRKNEGIFYEIENVTQDESSGAKVRFYHFFGFNIRGSRNLYRHFESQDGFLKTFVKGSV